MDSRCRSLSGMWEGIGEWDIDFGHTQLLLGWNAANHTTYRNA